jgi:polyribonucleotide nucleotidyltransferase
MRNDVQVVATVLSVDGENDPDMLAVTAASMALTLSGVPFDGPVAAVRVGKVEGKYVVNPTHTQREKSPMELVVSGTGEFVMMIEAGAALVSEEEIIEGIAFAQKPLATLVKVQHDFKAQVGKPARTGIFVLPNETLFAKVKELVTPELIESAVYVPSKDEREERINVLIKQTLEQVKLAFPEGIEGVNIEREVNECIDKVLKKYQQKQILEHGRRVDGRRLDETREITCEVGVLPRTHGSALFTRGETQVLSVVTLGSKSDEQILDGIEDPVDGTAKRYIHHYNMPGYSVGEVAPLRGPGRREIGHGALAEKAIEASGVLPKQEDFPYTMRLVSEAIASNGSTSMASTCGSSLALMDAGVPIADVIGGVAMGLVMDESNPSNFKVLTDIAGIEDFNGHMDFKVTGNEQGVSAMQMDIKVKGLTPEILAKAILQARPGRMFIISKMKEALPAPRAELSKYAPRITSFFIKPDKIREVIGTGGKVINAIIAATGVKIDIEDSGQVMVVSTDSVAAEKAVQWIQNIVKEIEPGEIYEGTVTRIMDFGAFVEVLPGKEGLVHISQLANYRVNHVEDVVKVGDKLKVQVSEIDDQGRTNLTHKPFAAPPTPEQLAAGANGGHDDRGPRPARRPFSGGGHDRSRGGRGFGGRS